MSTVTARLSEETALKLSQLAQTTNRSKSFIVAQALEHFLDEQAWQVAQIQESLAQADEGKFASSIEVQEAFGKWGLTVESD
ncbi:CopG family ribbon-helix-helix protein [Desulfomicrobium sp. ZS1]|uniref:CopG family ribbon-helix-helix protein n=1 Tax=Desulfomicrobium sp. ZS1 TaxID=2952228 RepID=UPI0020B27014|nr:CopG family ribbon-helix-helix protein [Desulfomicrobium sp. ZS1]UTF49993.1 CopG family ribbon-helix-helix protein [Desulfomicrobium sp. ZS1]